METELSLNDIISFSSAKQQRHHYGSEHSCKCIMITFKVDPTRRLLMSAQPKQLSLISTEQCFDLHASLHSAQDEGFAFLFQAELFNLPRRSPEGTRLTFSVKCLFVFVDL